MCLKPITVENCASLHYKKKIIHSTGGPVTGGLPAFMSKAAQFYLFAE